MEEVQQLILWRQKIEDFRGILGLAAALGRGADGAQDRDWRLSAKYERIKNYED